VLESLEIRRFRGLKHVSLNDLGPINLITGPNNIGKTSVLEALFVLAGGSGAGILATNTEALRGVPSLNIEFSEGGAAVWDGDFFNFDTSHPVEISAKERTDDFPGDLLKVILRVPDTQSEIQPTLSGTPASLSNVPSRSLEIEVSDRGQKQTYRQSIGMQGVRIDPPPPSNPTTAATIVTSGPPNHKGLADAFTQVVRSGMKHRVIAALKLLDGRIEDLELLQYGGNSLIHAHLSGTTVPIPLHLVGEGSQRLTNILLSVISSKNGFVCIDEIDNGIHYAALSNVFKALYEISSEYSVQLFGSTHSQTCVISAQQALEGTDSLRLYRMARDSSGEAEIFEYDQEAIEGAISVGLDLR
jgi:hypothetical protein